MAERDRHIKEIALKGKWISDLDGIVVADNFTTLKNMRYTDVYPRAVGGMTKLNSTAMLNEEVRNAFHFRRPVTGESHLVLQAEDAFTGTSALKTFESTIPNASNTLSASLYTLTYNGNTGYFSDSPGGGMAYCDGDYSLIWSGNNMRVGSIINTDPNDLTFEYDWTSKLTNSMVDSNNIAYLYASDDGIVTLYLGVIRPIYGFNFWINSANTSVGSWDVFYWAGDYWAGTTVSSDTTLGLTVTGTLMFPDTFGYVQQSMKFGLMMYWYALQITPCVSCSLSLITALTNPHPVMDIWDGAERSISAFYRSVSSVYQDDTLNVFTNDYDSTNELTYSDVSTCLDGTNFFVVGFMERMVGVHFFMPVDSTNVVDSVEMDIAYWDGRSWQTIPFITDGTGNGTTTLTQSGTITWNDPGETAENLVAIYNDIPMFFYRFSTTVAITSGAKVYHVAGIPASIQIKPYQFPIYAMDRLMLCNSVSDYPNKVLVSAQTSDCVFNGDDSVELFVGDENALTGAAWLYSQFGSSLYNVVAFTKANETWLLSGNDPESWTLYRASANIGCPAPLTIRVINAPQEQYTQSNRTVAIWQSSQGIFIFDGKAFTPIHGDIEDWFDSKRSYSINRTYIGDSSAFYDELNHEYHWLFKSGAAATPKEFVYDMRRKKWFEIDRGTGKSLMLGTKVMDTLGNTYCYGFTSDGYIQRLEYGNTFDGNNIVCELQTGDIALHQGSMWETTKIRNVKMTMVGKSTTVNNVTMTHYGDTATAGTAFALDPTPTTGDRVASGRVSANLGDYVFHRLGLSLSTGDEAIGFEPVYLGIIYETIRKDTRVD